MVTLDVWLLSTIVLLSLVAGLVLGICLARPALPYHHR
jgi:uncharacterized protein YneF (UPF0154 family)